MSRIFPPPSRGRENEKRAASGRVGAFRELAGGLAALGLALAQAGCLEADGAAGWMDAGVTVDSGGGVASRDAGASPSHRADATAPVQITVDGASPEADAEAPVADAARPLADAGATVDAEKPGDKDAATTAKDAATVNRDAASVDKDAATHGKDAAGSDNDAATGTDSGTTTAGIPNCAEATSEEQTAYESCSACDNASCSQYVAAAVVACAAYYTCFAETSCATAVMACAVDSNPNCDTAATELATCQGTFCTLDCSGM
jgi:hypothetical protein